MNAVSVRGDWVGQVVDGRYPLLEWLGGSGTSGTFLTELDGPGSPKAALKLIPSSPQAEDRLAGWTAAAKLSNPHLAEIRHYGRAEVNESNCAYIVYDLAEELLSQIIPERPLTADEAREMLNPILGALEYMHGAGFVHGHLKPSNVLVVENDIRLSSDSLLAIGKSAPRLFTNDLYTSPEITTEPVSPRADIWSLGVTLVEALTQQLPIWDAASDSEPVIPGSIPAPFAEIARRCLHADPAQRCSLADIRGILEGRAKPATVRPAPTTSQPPPRDRQEDKPLPARMPFLPLVVALALLVVMIVGFWLHGRSRAAAPVQTEATSQAPAGEQQSKPSQPEPQSSSQTSPRTASAPSPRSTAPASAARSTVASNSDVVTRDVPEVPQRASNTIHGTVSVIVKVEADSDGTVTNADYATHGPSAYFARLALESARKWKFKPAQQGSSALPSSWLLHYRFRRSGAEVTAEQAGR
ncbi:MAG: TonB family protein [Acidobacteria bacterium]|nr:TonB family protein [Acidobacteriota bacterium]